MLAAADLRVQRAVFNQIDPEQPAMGISLHAVLVHAVNSDFVRRLATFAYQPQHLGDGVAEWPNRADP